MLPLSVKGIGKDQHRGIVELTGRIIWIAGAPQLADETDKKR